MKMKTQLKYICKWIDLKKSLRLTQLHHMMYWKQLRTKTPPFHALDLTTMRYKNYYKPLTIAASLNRLLLEKKGINFENWKTKLSNIYRSSNDNKLRHVSFQLLHRTTVTKKELKTFGIVNSADWTFCLNPDLIEHAFFLTAVLQYPFILKL